ncbi:MAG: S41 family peptidase [Chloroflexota bacterium]
MKDTMTGGCKVLLIAAVGLLIAAGAFATGFGAGAVLAPLSPAISTDTVDLSLPLFPTATPTVSASPAEDETEAFNLFWEVWHILEQEFYGDLPDENGMTYGAIQGVLDTLDDPNTAFFDPEIAEIMREDMSGNFEGIGAHVRLREDGRLVIVAPIEGQPAEIAGLRRGDIILQADDVSLEGMTIWEAISYIRGPAGTVVRLTVLREGAPEPFVVEIERANIPMPTIETETLEGNLAYIQLYEFNSSANARLAEALKEALARESAGIILDLRNNPGGFLDEAVAVASQFISEGVVLVERFSDGSEQTYEATGNGLAFDVPLVLLVNAGSASASEIVAGAIQDTGRGVLIGETTFGKGSVQLVHRLRDGSELRVTVARWFTPNGRLIHEQGLEPDIAVELTVEDMDAGLDPQLDRAVEYLLNGK